MSEHKSIREHLPHGGRGRARAKFILRADPHKANGIDASDYSPPDALETDVKTGMRPLRSRLYKRGGKVAKHVGHVHGEAAKKHAGRKPRKSGGRAVEMINRDQREANEEREGSKHTGAFKRGGRAHRADGGSFVPTERMNFGSAGSSRMSKAAGLKRGGKVHEDAAEDRKLIQAEIKKHEKGCRCDKCMGGRTERATGGSTYGVSTPLRLIKTHTGPNGHVAKVYKDQDFNEYRVKHYSPEGKHMPKADYHTDDKSDAMDTAASAVSKGFKRGGMVHEDAAEDKKLIRDEIKKHEKGCRCAKCMGGRTGRSTGGSLDVMDGEMQGTRPTGYREVGKRSAHAHGGHVKGKGKTNINIVIGERGHPAAMPPGAGMPPAPPRGVPVPPPAPPMGGMPPGMPLGMPPGGLPGMMPPGGPPTPMPRKRGGRAVSLDATAALGEHDTGSGGGLGRLAKVRSYGHYD
jgi:hypothetical protein